MSVSESSSPKLSNSSASQASIWGIALVICVLAIVVANWRFDPQQAWLVTLGAMTVFVIAVGISIASRPAGIVIDNRNKVSLSKLQAVCWTIIVLSSFIAKVAANMKGHSAAPLDILIPTELLVAMGISLGTLVAAPSVLSLKTQTDPSASALKAAQETMDEQGSGGVLTTSGLVVGRSDPKNASWMDIFRGDEIGNFNAPDLGKVQAVLITLVLLGVYAGAVWQHGFDSSGMKAEDILNYPGGQLPPVSEQFVWLLAISHAGYLAYKAAPHSKADVDGNADAAPADTASADPRKDTVG